MESLFPNACFTFSHCRQRILRLPSWLHNVEFLIKRAGPLPDGRIVAAAPGMLAVIVLGLFLLIYLSKLEALVAIKEQLLLKFILVNFLYITFNRIFRFLNVVLIDDELS